MSHFLIRPLEAVDQVWVRQWMHEHWGGEVMIMHGEQFRPAEYPGFVAEIDGQVAGLVTYRIARNECEILSLDSLREGQGIGNALLQVVLRAARSQGVCRISLTTTNDNVDALCFYQKRGFQLSALHRNAVTEARRIKPGIPMTGNYDIPVRDEIELEIVF